jgi:hypothetical protein
VPSRRIASQQGIRIPAAQPQVFQLHAAAAGYFGIDEWREFEDANPACETLGYARQKLGADRSKQKESAILAACGVNYRPYDREEGGQGLGLIQNERLSEVLQGVFDVAGEYLKVGGPLQIEVTGIDEMAHECGFAALARP